MDEQRMLLEGMVEQATVSVKELFKEAEGLEPEQDIVGLEGAVLEAVLRLGAVLLGMMMTHWAKQLADKAGTRLECKCGQGKARWVNRRFKTILTLLGRVTYERVYFHCKKCRQGEGLGDRGWGLQETRTSLGVKHLLGYLSGTTVGFMSVASNVCRTLRWSEKWLSGKQVQRLAEPVGKLLGEREKVRIEKWWKMAKSGLLVFPEDLYRDRSEPGQDKQSVEVPQRLYVQMDGIFGRIRGALGKGSDYWREVKVGAVFWAEPGRHTSSLAELLDKPEVAVRQTARVWVDRPKGAISYVAGLLPAAEFGIRTYAAAMARDMEQAVEVVVLGDGAHWIWEVAQEHFSGAVQILDFHHAREWVRKVARAVWGESSPKAVEWADEQIVEHLIRGDAKGLVEAIAKLPKIDPPKGQKKSIPEQAMEYFSNNAERMHYPEYRARGLEIGSGIIESSGRRLVGLRCKQPGMRWSEQGLCDVIDLRTHALNRQYDSALADLPKAS